MTKRDLQQRIFDCLTVINKEIGKLNVKKLSQKCKERLKDIIIADEAKKFKLAFLHMKCIYYGKSRVF